MKNTIISIAVVIVLAFTVGKVSKIMIDDYTESCIHDSKRLAYKKAEYTRFKKWASELTPEQRDSVIELQKFLRGR